MTIIFVIVLIVLGVSAFFRRAQAEEVEYREAEKNEEHIYYDGDKCPKCGSELQSYAYRTDIASCNQKKPGQLMSETSCPYCGFFIQQEIEEGNE